MSEPFKVNFPVIREPYSGMRMLVYWSKDVKPAHSGVDATYVDVVGIREDGKGYKVRIQRSELIRARLTPVSFIGVESQNAPSGESIVDVQGKAVNT